MKLGKVKITPELLVDLLKIDSTPYGAEWSFEQNCLVLYLSGGSLPEVEEGEHIPYVITTYTHSSTYSF